MGIAPDWFYALGFSWQLLVASCTLGSWNLGPGPCNKPNVGMTLRLGRRSIVLRIIIWDAGSQHVQGTSWKSSLQQNAPGPGLRLCESSREPLLWLGGYP